MCLGERKAAYEVEGRNVTRKEQNRQVKHYKRTFPQAKQIHSHILQVVVADIDDAFQQFFKRVKRGEKPGYPRFKGRNRFRSFGLKEYTNGFWIDGRRLKITGVGRISMRCHRPIPENAKIKTVRICYQGGKWYACLACEIPKPKPKPKTGRVVGLDMGITALITSHEGEKLPNPKHYRQGQAELRRLQRKLARAKRGSKNCAKALRQVQRQQAHIANQRRDYLHKLTHILIKHCDGIAIEDLSIPNMVRNHRLSKSIFDSGWGIFKDLLVYKAESAGRKVVLVNPAYTSQTCSNPECHESLESLTLADRWVICLHCGLSLDRDHNAARNILDRAGWFAPVSPNVEQWLVRAAEATRIVPL